MKKKNSAVEAANTARKRIEAAKRSFRLLYEGYEVHSRGWPDLLGFNRKTGTFYFIECKRIDEAADPLTEDQQKVRKILKKIGKVENYDVWFFDKKKGSTKIIARAFYSRDRLHPYGVVRKNVKDKLRKLPNFVVD